jgi:hypothetical protein
MYVWSARSRLTPPRLVWHEPNYPEHEVVRYQRNRLRAFPQLGWKREGRVEGDRARRQRWAGRLGEWPHWRPDTQRPKRAS